MWCMHGTNKLSILDKGLSMGNTQRFQGPLFLDLKSTHYRNVMPYCLEESTTSLGASKKYSIRYIH